MVDPTGDDEGPAANSLLADGKQWLLLDGNRLVIAVGLTVAFWLAYLLLSAGGVAPLADTQSLFYAFSRLISGNFTLITVVVSINQLVLSQELQSPGELESEIAETVDYREEIESIANRPAPAEPSGFLRLVVESTRRDAQRLGSVAATTLPSDARDDVDEIVSDLTDEFDRIDGLVDESGSGSGSGIFETLSTDYCKSFLVQPRYVCGCTGKSLQ